MRGRVALFLLAELGAFLVVGFIGIFVIHRLTAVDSKHHPRIYVSESKPLTQPLLSDNYLSGERKSLATVYPQAQYDGVPFYPIKPLHPQNGFLGRRHRHQTKHCEITRTDPSFQLCRWPTRKDKFVSGTLAETGSWDDESLKSLKQIVHDKAAVGCTVLDVGAGLGVYGFYAAALGCNSILFEPLGDNVKLLNETQTLNNFPPGKVRIIHAAASNETGLGTLYMPHRNKDATSLVRPKLELERISGLVPVEVEMDKIDNHVKEDIMVMRMKVGGWETCALKGAENLLKKHNVSFIFLEVWQQFTPCMKVLDLLLWLHDLRYSMFTNFKAWKQFGHRGAAPPRLIYDKHLHPAYFASMVLVKRPA